MTRRMPASSEVIGFIGLGAMGGPMAKRLTGLGYSLLIHDVNAEALQSVVECGARGMPSPKAIASKAKIVFTCLPSLPALRGVVLGPDGLQAGDAIEVYVDLSTTGANFARELASRLAQRGIMMLDSPITGSVITAENGSLGIMCSGPEVAFQRVQPIMQDLASAAVLYLGDQTGKAQTLKSLNNLLSATGMAVSCEAFILGTKAGLDPQIILEVINSGDASSSASRNKFPRSVLPRRFDFGARMAITAKDISTTVHEAEESGVPMWVGQSVRQVWQYAVSQGGAGKDGTSLITFLEPWAKVEVRSRPETLARREWVPPSSEAFVDWVLICEARALNVLARRLRSQGWQVITVAEGEELSGGTVDPAIDADTSARRCTLLCVPRGTDPTDVLMSLRPSQARTRLVINALRMHSTHAKTLAQAMSDRGFAYLDALLVDTPQHIEKGSCGVLAGGEYAEFERAKPLLDAIGAPVFYISEKPGLAHLMQQINGSVFATLLAVTCEAFVAGAKAGLDPITMTKILGIETGRNAASSRIVPEQIATRRFDYGKLIGEAYQDLSLVSDEARRLGVIPWILDKVRLLYGLAAELGDAGDDITRLATHYEKWANTEITLKCNAKTETSTGAMVQGKPSLAI